METYRYPQVWRQLQTAGMTSDFTWARTALRYVDVYQKVMALKSA